MQSRIIKYTIRYVQNCWKAAVEAGQADPDLEKLISGTVENLKAIESGNLHDLYDPMSMFFLWLLDHSVSIDIGEMVVSSLCQEENISRDTGIDDPNSYDAINNEMALMLYFSGDEENVTLHVRNIVMLYLMNLKLANCTCVQFTKSESEEILNNYKTTEHRIRAMGSNMTVESLAVIMGDFFTNNIGEDITNQRETFNLATIYSQVPTLRNAIVNRLRKPGKGR